MSRTACIRAAYRSQLRVCDLEHAYFLSTILPVAGSRPSRVMRCREEGARARAVGTLATARQPPLLSAEQRQHTQAALSGGGLTEVPGPSLPTPCTNDGQQTAGNASLTAVLNAVTALPVPSRQSQPLSIKQYTNRTVCGGGEGGEEGRAQSSPPPPTSRLLLRPTTQHLPLSRNESRPCQPHKSTVSSNSSPH